MPQVTHTAQATHRPQATRKGLTRGGFLGKFVVKSLERPTERVALGTLLHRLPRPIHPKTSPCKPARGGPLRRELKGNVPEQPKKKRGEVTSDLLE